MEHTALTVYHGEFSGFPVGIGKSLLQNISDFAQQLTEDTQNPQTAVLSALEAPGSYKPPVDLTYCPPTDSTGEVHPAFTKKGQHHAALLSFALCSLYLKSLA